MIQLLSPLFLALAASAAVLSERQSDFNVSVIANYDSLEYAGSPTPIGENYQGLNYTNFYLAGSDNDIIRPASLPHVAMSYDCTLPRVITVTPSRSPFLPFIVLDLKSVALACSSGFPQADCSITIRGEDFSGNLVATKTLVYPALQNPTPFKMKKFVFDSKWSGLYRIIFSKVEINGTCNYTGLMVDDLSYFLRRGP